MQHGKKESITIKLKNGFVVDSGPMGQNLGMFAFDITRVEKICSRYVRVTYVVGCPRIGYKDLIALCEKVA